MNLAHIELSQLVISPANMRAKKKNRDIADLIPSVRARGVLVPLLVRPNGAPDMYEIVAGRRRYFAAKAVSEETGETIALPCAIMAPGDDAAALEASLIENVARLDPDEVAQWETFARLIREGRSVEDIAAIFDIPEATVRRVLALGNLLPRILTLYRTEQIEAYTRLVARASRVFNSEQVAGWAPPPPRTFGSRVEVLASVETFTRATKATITHGGDIACYDVVRDVIKMPVPERFTGSPTSTPSQAYQAVLLHELVHWSGAKHRLDRKLTGLSLTDRAREELVAELGAAFLCADLGIANDPRPDHAAYVDSWLAVLKRDTRAVFTAARQAGAAANFLHDLAAGGS